MGEWLGPTAGLEVLEKSLLLLLGFEPRIIYTCVCVCLCVEHMGNVRNLDLLNCASRLRRTYPDAAATYRQIHEALPAANSGNGKGTTCSYKHVCRG